MSLDPTVQSKQYSAVFIYVTTSPQSIANIYPNITFRTVMIILMISYCGFSCRVHLFNYILAYEYVLN